MLDGSAKRIFNKGPAGPPGATLASALTDVAAGMKAVLTAVDLASARAAFGLTIGSSVQAWSATLDTLGALSTTVFGRSLLTQADAATALGTLGAAPAGRQISTPVVGGLQGGGDLSADRAISIATNGVGNAMLAQVPAGTLKANLLGSTANASDQTLSTILDALIGSGRGTIAVRGAAGWAALTLGATGYTLQSNGSDLVFAAASPGTGAVRYDAALSLTVAQQLQGRQNTGVRGAGVLAKSAAYTVAAADAGKLISCSGTWPLSLPSASSVGNGFAIEIANTGTGKVTLTPNGSETIGGLTAIVVNLRESGVLISDGANWQAVGFSPVIVASSFAAGAGYVRWSNGYTKQWGTVTTGADTTVTFPLAYSNTPAVTATINNVPTSQTTAESVSISALGVSSFTGRPRAIGSGSVGQSGEYWSWIAEGNI